MRNERETEELRSYRRAVRGGKRPKDSFKFTYMRNYAYDGRKVPAAYAVSRRVDEEYLGWIQSELGRFIAISGMTREVGSFATREDAAIGLEGAHELKRHKAERKRAEKERLERRSARLGG